MLQASTHALILAAALLAATPSRTARAADDPLVLPLSTGPAPSRRAAHALVAARTRRVLQQARRLYAGSRFERCAAVLARTEGQLQGVMLPRLALRDLALLKVVNQWLGLCRAVGAQADRARADFARAARLPGPQPDADVFPPAVLQLYRAASRDAVGSCRARVPDDVTLWLDGRPLRGGAPVLLGEHYAIWRGAGGQSGSGRLSVPPDCALALPTPAAGARLTAAEARDAAFLQAVGREAGARRLLIVGKSAHLVQHALFDVSTGRFVEREQDAVAAQRLLGGAVAPVVTPTPPVPALERPRKRPRRRVRSKPWYRRWWVWAVVGAGVAAAVAIPLAATSGETRYDLSF